MGRIITYSYTQVDLDDHNDFTKTIVLQGLVRDGLLSEEEADTWAASHTIIMQKKSIFQTITNAWRNEKELESGEHYYKIVHDPSAAYMRKNKEEK